MKKKRVTTIAMSVLKVVGLTQEGFFVYIRYYGPLKPFNDKTWIPNDVELVK